MIDYCPISDYLAKVVAMVCESNLAEGQKAIKEHFGTSHDSDIKDIFLDSLETAMDTHYRYKTRRAYLDNAILLYKTFEFIQQEWVYDDKAVKYIDKFYQRKWEAPKLMPFEDGINYDAPEDEGLYFIGMVNANPHTGDLYYWVKIGYSSMLKDRMRNYNTDCPMLWRIGFNTAYGEQSRIAEKQYHRMLNKIALASCNHNDEWFLVSRDTYFEMCSKGFSYFD